MTCRYPPQLFVPRYTKGRKVRETFLRERASKSRWLASVRGGRRCLCPLLSSWACQHSSVKR